MIKKLYYSIAAVALLAATSCSQDDLGTTFVPEGQEANVTLSVNLPQNIQSRNYSDGTTATTLEWALYDITGGAFTQIKVVDDDTIELRKEMTLQLVSGRSYGVVFFAHADGAPYTVTMNDTEAKIEVDYSGIKANDENLDAFYGYKTFAVNGNAQIEAKLYRPFAQINVGTNDFEASVELGFAPSHSTVTVSKVYKTLNLLDGTVSDEVTDQKFAYNVIADPEDETFPVQPDYDYLAMVYALVDAEQELVNVEFSYAEDENGTKEQTRTVTNVPVRANYRTNIYGQILTDNVTLNVEIVPGFEEPDYDLEQGTKAPEKNDEGAYLITSQAELFFIAERVNAQDPDYMRATYELQNDIVMSGNWTPIGASTNKTFWGKFHGNGYTIYNLNVEANEYAGFFGVMYGQVEDLHFDGATINTNHYAGVVAAYNSNNSTNNWIKNCSVKNSSVTLATEYLGTEWDNGDKGAIIIGYAQSGIIIDGNKVENCTLQGYRDLGGIVGYSVNNTVTNNIVDGLDIIVDNSHNYKSYDTLEKHDAGAIIGEKSNMTVDPSNKADNVTISMPVATAADLTAALAAAEEGEVITLGAAQINIKQVTFPAGKEITIVGSGKDKTILSDMTYIKHAPGSTFNFSNLTFRVEKSGTGTSMGFEQSAGGTFENVDFYGEYHTFWNDNGTADYTFKNCNFYYDGGNGGARYALWIDGDGKTVVENCVFDPSCKENDNIETKAVLVYSTTNRNMGDIDFKNCEFIVTGAKSTKAAIEIHSENFDQAGTINIDGAKWKTGDFVSLWQEVSGSQPTQHYTVIVDGVQEQPAQ